MDAWNTLYTHNTQLTPYQECSYCSIIGKYSAVLKRHCLKNAIYELRNTDDQTIMVLPLHIERTRTQTIAYIWGEKSQSGYLDFIYDEQIQTETFLSAMKLIRKDNGNVKFVLNRITEQSKLNELIQTAFTPLHYNVSKSI
jgi:hypothetical protein